MRTAIKRFRYDIGLKQSEIAEKIGVSRVTYSNVERGTAKGTIEFWKAFQKAFDIPAELLWAIQGGSEKAYNLRICENRECKKWYEETRFKNAK